MNLRLKIDIIFIVTAIAVSVLLYITYQNTSYVKESGEMVNQTNQFLHSLENLETSINQLETSTRGFLLFGNDGLYERIEKAKHDVKVQMEEVDKIMNQNPRLTHYGKQLGNLVQDKINISVQLADLRKNESMESAVALISTGKGIELMDEISGMISEIEKSEYESLRGLVQESKSHFVNQNSIYVTLFIFVFSIILLFHFQIRKSTLKELQYKEQQVKLNQELQNQNKQLDDFINIITHNLRSPVNNITSLIALLNDKAYENDHVFIFDKLNYVSANLNETLNELLETQNIKQNTSIDREELKLKEIFDKTINSLQGDILTKNAIITSKFDACPEINYPRTYLESIFHNLLSNALKYSMPGRTPEIHVISEMIDDKPVLKVADNGLGMDLGRIGDKIFGLRKTFHTTVNSKGIGLFMTKAHVESLGGEISVESKVNEGSTFTVVFEKESPKKPLKNSDNKKNKWTVYPLNFTLAQLFSF